MKVIEFKNEQMMEDDNLRKIKVQKAFELVRAAKDILMSYDAQNGKVRSFYFVIDYDDEDLSIVRELYHAEGCKWLEYVSLRTRLLAEEETVDRYEGNNE